jgi:hypothetical protein
MKEKQSKDEERIEDKRVHDELTKKHKEELALNASLN